MHKFIYRFDPHFRVTHVDITFRYNIEKHMYNPLVVVTTQSYLKYSTTILEFQSVHANPRIIPTIDYDQIYTNIIHSDTIRVVQLHGDHYIELIQEIYPFVLFKQPQLSWARKRKLMV